MSCRNVETLLSNDDESYPKELNRRKLWWLLWLVSHADFHIYIYRYEHVCSTNKHIIFTNYALSIKNVKVKFILEQVMKTQRGRREIIFLYHRR